MGTFPLYDTETDTRLPLLHIFEIVQALTLIDNYTRIENVKKCGTKNEVEYWGAPLIVPCFSKITDNLASGSGFLIFVVKFVSGL